jgi:lipopolysaccharide export system protein LptC
MGSNDGHRMSRTAPQMKAAHSFHLGEDTASARGSAMHEAQKHSRRVQILRIALPAVAGAGLILVVLFLLFDPLSVYRQLPVQFSNLAIQGNKITMEAPKLIGLTRDKKPYNVTAESAVQDLTQPNIIELHNIHGNVDQESRGGTEVRAKAGVYDIKAENLQLHGGIEIHSETGYHVYLNDAFIEVKKGRMVTKNPVNATFPDGSLQAARAEITEHGSVVFFDGGVVVDLKLPPPEKPEDAAAKSAAKTGTKK